MPSSKASKTQLKPPTGATEFCILTRFHGQQLYINHFKELKSRNGWVKVWVLVQHRTTGVFKKKNPTMYNISNFNCSEASWLIPGRESSGDPEKEISPFLKYPSTGSPRRQTAFWWHSSDCRHIVPSVVWIMKCHCPVSWKLLLWFFSLGLPGELD